MHDEVCFALGSSKILSKSNPKMSLLDYCSTAFSTVPQTTKFPEELKSDLSNKLILFNLPTAISWGRECLSLSSFSLELSCESNF